ncbi:MAG: hypothetical protein ACXACD_02680 [Candidatus Thorarchaeota archaeon]
MSTINAEPVRFEWEPVDEAGGYELMLMTPTRTQPLYITLTVPSLELFLNSASGIPGETDGDYSWAVRTLDEDDQGEDDLGEFSATWTFRIDTLYNGQPSLIAPLDGESFDGGTVFLQWQVPEDSSGTQYTVVQVYNSSVFTPENLIHQENVFAPTLELTLTALETGTYFWRCQAVDVPGNPCDWSAAWNFSVDITVPEMPPMPAPIAPPVTMLEMGTHYVDESGTIYVTSMTEFNLIASSEFASDITTSYCIDQGPWLEFDTPFYLSGQGGVRNISFYSSDASENNEDSQRIQVVLTSVNLRSGIFQSRWFTDRVMFNVILENNWPLEITQLEMNLDIPEDFRIRHLSVWLKESEGWPRPLFLFLSSRSIFGGPRSYNFRDEMEITFEDNKLFVPSVPIGGKLLVFVSLKYAPEGELSDSTEEFLPLEYTFGATAVVNATSSYDPDQGLFDVCSTQQTIEMYPPDYFDTIHSFGSYN